ncbi:recombinase family protein [Shewanella vesiculosa]|uniref:Recombinase family protein n=1 Tax=Shewanella vesiculosa TaxID=518738 RepID=A0ABV0FV28_9GAMM
MSNETLAYVRVSTKQQNIGSQLSQIEKWADLNSTAIDKIWHEEISGTVPAAERPELSQLLKVLRKGDTLVIWWIDRLGRNYTDSGNTIRSLLERGVTIKTVNQNLTLKYQGNTQEKMMTDMTITLLTGMAESERINRLASAQAGRDKLTNAEWTEKYQGRKQDEELHNKIKECLAEKMSIRKIADALSCSTTTVQKVKKSI